AQVSDGRRASRRSPLGSCTRIRVSLGVAVIVARMPCLAGWGASTRREAHGRELGQLFGTPIHHAVLLAPPRTPLPIAVPMVGKSLLALLVTTSSLPPGLPDGRLRAHLRAVLPSIAIALAADHEDLPAPPAAELPAVQHPSSIRKLGTDDATGQTPPVSRGLSRARKEDPAPALQDKATGSSSI